MANKRLNAIITIGGAVSASLGSALGGAKSKIMEVGDAVRKLEQRQKLLGNTIQELRKSGMAVGSLQSKYAAVTREIEKQRAALQRLKVIEDKRSAFKSAVGDVAGKAAAVGATVATVGYPIVKAAQFEKDMLGVAKQVDGARDAAGNLTDVYFNMRQQIQLLGREMPMATGEIAKMVTAGARMGVAKDDLIQFTKLAGTMATAFDADAEQLAESMGKVAGMFKIPIKSVGDLADAINYLDDNAISKGSDIIDFLTRTGGVAAAVKVTAQEMAALGSTLLTLGERTETASTATNAMFQKFAAADKGTKKFKAAMKEIGLSTAAVQKGMQTNAQGTLLTILEAVQKLPKDKQLGVMVELVGLEHSDTMAKLANNIEEYRKQIKLATEDEKRKGSMDREMQARMQTTAAQWEVFKNRIGEVAVNLGTIFLPAVNAAMGALAGVTSGIADFVRENSTLVQAVGAAVAAFVGFQAVGTIISAVRVAWMGLSLAMMANPIGLVIAGLAAGAVLVYKNWEPIKGFFIGMWDGITSAFQKSIDWIMGKINWVGEKAAQVRSLFGFGDGKGGPSLPMMNPLPMPMPAMAGAASGAVTVQQTNDIKIQQLPGESQEALARRVADEIERRNRVKARGSLTDGANQ